MPTNLLVAGVLVAFIILILIGVMIIISKFYRKVDQGKALIINKMKAEPEVTFTGGIVYPIIHRAEVMDISVKTIELERRGHEGLICKDNVRADIKVTFFVRVNKTGDDVLKVAQAIGCMRASDQKTLEELFVAKFSEALKTVGKRLEFEQLYTQRDDFKDQIIEVIGKDLNGYVLDDAAIDFLEQTPLEALDAQNILDAQGIRKITELTATQNIRTNEIKQKERMEIGSQNLKADEAIFRFDQQRADAEAKKAKEISIAQTRESNEALRVKADEEKRTALTRQKAEEEVSIGEQNKMRAVEVSMKAREREVTVEGVRVKKAADLEEVSREREVELQRIAKEKNLEVERREIADVIRGRIAVEKTVAEEEERIKDLRAHAEAERHKKVTIIGAEAEAQEKLVKDIKAAEAQEEVAKHDARKRLITAEADLEAADKTARAKIRMSEGVQAEEAATGLAKVRVQEAEAAAIEKQGRAKATVTLEQMQAEAAGDEKKGLAKVKVRDAEADVTRKEGEARADVVRGVKLAEAAGDQEKGLAVARVREAEAAAIEKQGVAEAVAIKEKLTAEAAGLAEKAAAMKALDGVGREHEEFRLRLDVEKQVAVRRIDAQVSVAEHQAKVLASAFEQARINIVGGDGQFFDRFVQAVSLGRSVDGFVEQSDTAQKLLSPYLEGGASLPADLKEILAGKVTAENLKNVGLGALLAKLAGDADGDLKRKLESLAQRARELGLDQAGR
ncbi:MAG: hypothetical protein KC620_01105 [Myxococcales bacterium]|nr:hypothetical protein [Myxococcales bacterium]